MEKIKNLIKYWPGNPAGHEMERMADATLQSIKITVVTVLFIAGIIWIAFNRIKYGL